MILSKCFFINPGKNPFLRYSAILLLLISPVVISGQHSSKTVQPSAKDAIKPGSGATDNKPVIKSIDEYLRSNQENPAEKIFLHSDRTDYMQGDTIWLKAYLWYGYDQVPDTISGVLHAELIDKDGHVIIEKKLLIQSGTSVGDFSLDSAISPGNYFLRAYTRLMQNPQSGEPFYRLVNISPANQNFQFECLPVIIKQTGNDSLKIGLRFFEIDKRGTPGTDFKHEISYSLKIGDHLLLKGTIQAENRKESLLRCGLADIKDKDSLAKLEISIKDNGLTFEKQFMIPVQEGIDLQFLPEGGTMVNGLESKIAFKAIGADGKAREIAGEIQTEEGTFIALFRSINRGMGSFRFKPEAGKNYFARLRYNDINYVVPLPHASEGGTVMSVSYMGTGNDQILSVKQRPPELISQKYIVGSSHGKIWFSALLKSFRDSARLKIPLEMLPEGICRLTVLNEYCKPECERLIYVDKNQRFKIEVKPDSLSYGTRSKVTLLIKATGQGGEPVNADMSIAVLDNEQAASNSNFPGIIGYKLLESELHGNIENAESYFYDGCLTDRNSMDLLLLTHGYRKFLIKPPETNWIEFQPEKSINVTGRIELPGARPNEKKYNYPDINLTLFTNSDKYYLAQSHPDSQGLFRFRIPLRYGKAHSMIQATSPKKKPFQGDILLDRPVVMQKQFSFPSINYNVISPVKESVNRIQPEIKNEIVKEKHYGTMNVALKEVVVTAKADSRSWFSNYDKDASRIANLDSLDPGGNKYKDLNDLLIREFKAIPYFNSLDNSNTVLLPCIQTICFKGCLSHWFPIYVVDGNTYWNGEGFDFTRLRTISAFPVYEIKRIMVIPPMKPIVIHHAWIKIWEFPQFIMQSMVVIETYSKDTYRGDSPGIKTFLLDGLDAPRIFYSPSYEGQKRQNPEYDDRTTLYWDPSRKTDSSGQTKVEFYTGDRKTSFEVIINGIEIINGYPGEKYLLIK